MEKYINPFEKNFEGNVHEEKEGNVRSVLGISETELIIFNREMKRQGKQPTLKNFVDWEKERMTGEHLEKSLKKAEKLARTLEITKTYRVQTIEQLNKKDNKLK